MTEKSTPNNTAPGNPVNWKAAAPIGSKHDWGRDDSKNTNQTHTKDYRECVFCRQFCKVEEEVCKQLTSGKSYVQPGLKVSEEIMARITGAQAFGIVVCISHGGMTLWRPFMDKKKPHEVRYAVRYSQACLPCGTPAQDMFDHITPHCMWLIGFHTGVCSTLKEMASTVKSATA